MLAQPISQNSMTSHLHQNPAVNVQGYASSQWGQDLPLQRPYARSVGSYGQGLTYAQHEIMRARKTPSGRRLESVDFANIDETIRLPAPKHILLSPTLEDTRNHLSNSRRQFDQDQHTQRTESHTAHQDYSQFRDAPCPPAWSFPGGLDSALLRNGSSTNNRRAYHNPHSEVPTVMPANFHSSLGPTASAAQQYYGPYWPDGTFSPYRPAPVRDDRFFHWRHSRGLSGGSAFIQPHGQNSSSNLLYNRADCTYQLRTNMIQGVEALQSLPPRDAYVPYASFHDRVSGALDSTNIPYAWPSTAAQLSSSTQTAKNLSDQYYSGCNLHATPASERIDYKDRTFAWAYRVYIDLLAQIQRDSKPGKQQPGLSGQPRSANKPVIFPRPPQRSQSHFAETQTLKVRAQSLQSVHSASNLRRYNSEDVNSRPSTAIRLPRRTSDSGTELVSSQNHVGSENIFNESKIKALNSNTLRGSLKPSLPGFKDLLGAHQGIANARSALEIIEGLCYDADMFWTDGMLLAGCLAYGIGDYERALGWYQKVLSQDMEHVEAMSNLAAALLALGRHEEAIKHWSIAIELRPSYFEAVEHLVGLFVSSGRTKDAVSIIDHVESSLRLFGSCQSINGTDTLIEDDSDDQSRTSSATLGSVECPYYDFQSDRRLSKSSTNSEHSRGYSNFGYAMPAADNGRLLALIHAKGNMLYSLGNNIGAAQAFEAAILVATGDRASGMKSLIGRILRSCVSSVDPFMAAKLADSKEPILLSPERAQQISLRLFPPSGDLPGLESVPTNVAYRAAVSTTSNSLLSLAKIYQDGLCSQSAGKCALTPGTREILALYYLSLSLQPSPSTANNVGILLASVQTTSIVQVLPQHLDNTVFNYSGVTPGSGVALALAYYNYGLNLDGKHAHLYTNLGSLLKDLGELQAAIKMYETAVSCDENFDIALANLANAVKDQGRIADAIKYYKRAVKANPDFAEAVCGLATALNSVCAWVGRGGVYADEGQRDKVHVDERGMMYQATKGCGWMSKVVETVEKQLRDGETWGIGILTGDTINQICRQLTVLNSGLPRDKQLQRFGHIQQSLQAWSGRKWEGQRVVRLIERAVKRIGWQWYQDRYKHKKEYPARRYVRPQLPANIAVPSAPTVLPFHTFTTPLSAKQVRQISQRNALRISVSTLRASWLPQTVYPPPAPPNPCLLVGYVSSDFNNHPLAHLMQSIFGLHNPNHVRAHCYATTTSDGSIHRQQIEREAPIFRDASSWNVEKLLGQIVEDGIHILINLNGYTRGAKNELFAARPAPIHMSFMGFAGTLGAEWCDYVYADEISVPRQTLAPFRYNVDIEDKLNPRSQVEDEEDWIYAENVIFSRSTFFCVDHKQSAPDATFERPPLQDDELRGRAWQEEQKRRWTLRKELFPALSDTAVILGNFNQLYKIDPTTFRMYLRILNSVPNAVLWLLRFPDMGEQNLMAFAREWAGPETASRIVFTDVAPKGAHITRASVVDLFLDTPECNAHTTAADVIWSGTPIITWAKWEYKMCSRMASSIVASALPEGLVGDEGRRDLLVSSEKQYEEHAIRLASTLYYGRCTSNDGYGTGTTGYGYGYGRGRGKGRLMELRRLLWEGRWTSRLFDTKRWVCDLERAYWEAWSNWEAGIGGDIWL